jgi:hypothetical protein
MQRAISVFIVVYLVVSVACGLGAGALPEKMAQYAGMALLPALIVPFIMAYVCHKMSGAEGNPFRGLTWGGAGIGLAYLYGLLLGLLTLAAAIGLGLMGIDFGMGDYIDMIKASSEQEIPAEAERFLSIGGWGTVIGGPTLGAFFGAGIACLATLPLYGWLGRRLLARGRGVMIGTLIVMALATGWVQAMVPNPMAEEVPLWIRAALGSCMGAIGIVIGSWLFLRYRSAFVPALFAATFNGVLAAGMVVSSDAHPVLAPPGGVAVALAMLVFGAALWILKDPGGNELALAAVAPDGTALTPEQLTALPQSSPGAPES